MIEAVVFDSYGTLFDINALAENCEQLYFGKGPVISNKWRQKQVEYTWLRVLMDQYADFAVITKDALTYTLDHLNLSYNEAMLEKLVEQYLNLPLFPDVNPALEAFKTRPLVLLSNGTSAMLDSLLSRVQLQQVFAHVLSADSIQTYKPDPAVYALATRELNINQDKILYISGNPWDVAGAKAYGFTVAWVNRENKPLEQLGYNPDYTVQNLLELAHQFYQ